MCVSLHISRFIMGKPVGYGDKNDDITFMIMH